MQKLFLLDAYALIYRSYYAFIKNPRINSKGLNTSAIMGFLNTLNEVLTKEKPTHIGVAFDPHGPTFRSEAFPAYKAQREETPEDIRKAVPIIKDLLKAYRIPILQVDGFEADDVIGTLAEKAGSIGVETYMLTPDKDYGQLVRDNVFIYRPRHGGGYETMGPKEICEKYNIPSPMAVIDLLALMGDSADNFPGCPGVGEKTAAKLIDEFGSIEQLLARSSEIKGKLREKVEQHVEDIKMSYFLATIKTDVPIELDMENLKLVEPNEDELGKLLTELEMKSFADRVLKKSQKPQKVVNQQLDLFAEFATDGQAVNENTSFETLKTTPHNYKLVENQEDLKKLCDYFLTNKILSLDTETTSTSAIDAELVGLSFAVKEFEAFYVPVPANREEALQIVNIFKPAYENPEILKVGQNLKYDLEVLRNYGIELKGKMWDTMIAHYLIQPELHHNMDYMAEIYLNYQTIHIEELIGPKGKNQKSMRSLPPSQVYEYAAEDADITLRLKNKLEPELKKAECEDLFYNIEMPLMPVLAEMELNGVCLDTASLAETSKQFTNRMNEIEARIYELAGEQFNIASPKQVGEILFDKLKIVEKAKKTKTGQYVTSEEVLQQLRNKHEIVADILEHRGLKKLIGTYIDALPKLINPKTGHIHTSFNQTITATGRLSSSDPNLQNIPIRGEDGKEIRKAFIPEPGCLFFSADYSQIELRVMAHLSQDAEMIKVFSEGKDLHAATAANIYKKPIEEVTRDERTKSKRANFGIIYGITVFGLAERLDIPRDEAKMLIDGYFDTFPQVHDYMEKSKEVAREKGYVTTLFGRRRYLPDINSHNATVRGFAERNAINAPIQGTAADIIKVAMIRIYNRFKAEGIRSKMILQVHDELNFSVYPDEKEKVEGIVLQEMQNALNLSVPLVADSGFGKNWLEAH
ncbi:DNA polymerase I [Xylanibacter ruminicola]|uniref:DNA polymerase I n=2 Tax=Xylanibacter ruminicola TaxID=839 RepID=D5EWK7_XYLR2|nr:DNA polymerase I [Xylanibacter ruminicola]ADE81354.1 DNA-directed DNA polymerase [Xylanibacter ruminicola 23]GJG31951.1 DNA polymerase I [Xylanibacter ruminicola]SEH86805.1 DNA polymerase I [Xylanibacter ruminicola]